MSAGAGPLLHVVMNSRVVGDIHRTGRQLRLRYEHAAQAEFTPLSVSMPDPAGRDYRRPRTTQCASK